MRNDWTNVVEWLRNLDVLRSGGFEQVVLRDRVQVSNPTSTLLTTATMQWNSYGKLCGDSPLMYSVHLKSLRPAYDVRETFAGDHENIALARVRGLTCTGCGRVTDP